MTTPNDIPDYDADERTDATDAEWEAWERALEEAKRAFDEAAK